MKLFSNILSIVFHPLFVLTYMLALLLISNPFAFGYRSITDADILFIIVIFTSIVLPMVAIGVSNLLGLIQSMQMPTRHERIAPLLITFVMHLSLYLHITWAEVFPWFFRVCALGVVLAIGLAFFMNNFTKISLHAVGMGGFVSMTTLMVHYFAHQNIELNIPFVGELQMIKWTLLFLVIIIAGAVCSARLYLKAHSTQDVYGGFVLGFFAQLIAFLILQ